MLPRGRPGRSRPHFVSRRIAVLCAALFTAIAVGGLAGIAPANAGTDDYPTSIGGCHYANNPGGQAFTCDLKTSAQDSLIDPWNEYNRECTSFVAWRLHTRNSFEMPFHDNASGWSSDAQSRSYTVNSTPAVGSVAWWGVSTQHPVGHVAWVEAVNGTNVTVEQYNANNDGTYSEQTMAASSVGGFIHFKDISGSSGTAFRAAFQANTGYMFTYDSNDGAANTWQGMKSGTNPAIAVLSTGVYQMVFQANTGHLYAYNSQGGGGDTNQPMMAGTSPSIVAWINGGSYRVAFQGSDGYLHYYDSYSGPITTSQGMASGTNPAITVLSTNVYEMAYQGANGDLWVYTPGGTGTDTNQPMMAGTSPSIAPWVNGGSYRVAFQGSDGNLHYYDSYSGPIPTTQGMKSSTSPSITRVPGGYETAFQANTGYLVVYGDVFNANTGQGMMAGTSPSIVTNSSTGGVRAAFQINTGYIYLYDSASGTIPTDQGMASGTSPSISWHG